MSARTKKNQGQHWISDHKRLSLYLRDGLACAYCGQSIIDGIKLTLDHLMPHSLGGGNESENLISCCSVCNSSRGNRDYKDFAQAAASYRNNGVTAEFILNHIQECINRPLDTKYAKTLVERQGSCFKVLQTL